MDRTSAPSRLKGRARAGRFLFAPGARPAGSRIGLVAVLHAAALLAASAFAMSSVRHGAETPSSTIRPRAKSASRRSSALVGWRLDRQGIPVPRRDENRRLIDDYDDGSVEKRLRASRLRRLRALSNPAVDVAERCR